MPTAHSARRPKLNPIVEHGLEEGDHSTNDLFLPLFPGCLIVLRRKMSMRQLAYGNGQFVIIIIYLQISDLGMGSGKGSQTVAFRRGSERHGWKSVPATSESTSLIEFLP
jgi:hypothetical protein